MFNINEQSPITWKKAQEILGTSSGNITRSIKERPLTVALVDAEIGRKIKRANKLLNDALDAQARMSAYLLEGSNE